MIGVGSTCGFVWLALMGQQGQKVGQLPLGWIVTETTPASQTVTADSSPLPAGLTRQLASWAGFLAGRCRPRGRALSGSKAVPPSTYMSSRSGAAENITRLASGKAHYRAALT